MSKVRRARRYRIRLSKKIRSNLPGNLARHVHSVRKGSGRVEAPPDRSDCRTAADAESIVACQLAPTNRQLRPLGRLDSIYQPWGTKMCVLCVLRALCPSGGPMSPNEPSWKMLTALLAVITLSTALFYAGLPPAIAAMPCFLLDMLMRGRLQW